MNFDFSALGVDELEVSLQSRIAVPLVLIHLGRGPVPIIDE